MGKERIKSDEHDNWECICGNVAIMDGFDPCNEEGEFQEPDIEWGRLSLYRCNKCFRVIRQESLEVIAHITDPQRVREIVDKQFATKD